MRIAALILFLLVPSLSFAADPAIDTARREVDAAQATIRALPPATAIRDRQAKIAIEIAALPEGNARQQLVAESERIADELAALQRRRAEADTRLRMARERLTAALEAALRGDLGDEDRLEALAEYAALLADRAHGPATARVITVADLADPAEQLAYLQLQRKKLSRTVKDLEGLEQSVRDHRRLTERRQQLARVRRLFEEDLEDRLRTQSNPSLARGDLLDRIVQQRSLAQGELTRLDAQMAKLAGRTDKEGAR